jgi:hypothetical protein
MYKFEILFLLILLFQSVYSDTYDEALYDYTGNCLKDDKKCLPLSNNFITDKLKSFSNEEKLK